MSGETEDATDSSAVRAELVEQQRSWTRANMTDGWRSAPSLSKKLTREGLSEAEIDHLLTSVAAGRARTLRIRGFVEIAVGLVFFAFPFFGMLNQIAQGATQVNVPLIPVGF